MTIALRMITSTRSAHRAIIAGLPRRAGDGSPCGGGELPGLEEHGGFAGTLAWPRWWGPGWMRSRGCHLASRDEVCCLQE